ncbi:hypothetical protein J5N97_024807 [Dioscorea zingiberensis]|uniref:GDSL esterase/lipase n=1 Tax=Dioscorea zingiberensis TaxID=325984 RepID=A0A9D5H9A4_9LILI|nr:hypothetical protein J5N97_024807 [Dioscorea zingiberensis]
MHKEPIVLMAMKMKPSFIGIILLLVGITGSDAFVPPAFYVFGDSLNDVGNNNYLPDPAPKSNFPHHGINFPGGIPTGRWSNGFIGIDYLAYYMGFRRSPPPYLSVTNEVKMSRGTNFASSGSGILDSTGQGTISLRRQVNYFQGVSGNLSRRFGRPIAYNLLSASIFYISSGNNDILEYFFALGPQNKTTNYQFIGTLLDNFKVLLTTLYNSGARKFGVLGTSTIGCIPIVRSSTPSGDCVEELNNLSQQFKNETRVMLQQLKSTMVGMKYSFVDSYEMTNLIKANSNRFGFRELLNACCGSGRFNGEAPCTPNATLCSDPDKYFSWDAYHPTQAISQLVSEMSFFGTMHVTPVNIRQLVNS